MGIMFSIINAQCENIQIQGPCNNNNNCQWYANCGICVDSIQEPCPVDNFLDVGQFDGAGGQYPNPQLSVSCDNNSINQRCQSESTRMISKL